MKRKHIYILIACGIILLLVVPLVVNRVYSVILNKSYPKLGNITGKGYRVIKVPFTGKLQFEHTDLSADYVSDIYMDTVQQNFKIITSTYAGFDDAQISAYITFDKNGKILQTVRYVPRQNDSLYQIDRETLNAAGKPVQKTENVKEDKATHLQNCTLLYGELPPFPKWKNRASPVYINHFSKSELNLQELNPFALGGINGGGHHSLWYGFAYCDIRFMDKIVKVKIPFGYDKLLLATDEYEAELQYYPLPKAFRKTLPMLFIQLDDEVYIITAK